MRSDILTEYIKEELAREDLASFRENDGVRTYNPQSFSDSKINDSLNARIQSFSTIPQISPFRHDDYRGLLGVHVLKSEVGEDFAYRPLR